MFGTVRARLGYAMGKFMPYVTAGLAWDRLRENETCPSIVCRSVWLVLASQQPWAL